MLRSFHYAAYSALLTLRDQGLIRSENSLSQESAIQGPSIPKAKKKRQALLDIYLLEKAI
jgi:hypothetical protein